MEVQDYEYYEARVNDVNLEDITSSHANNADILARLRDNDPEFTRILLTCSSYGRNNFVVREGDHLGWLGYFVGRSDKVTKLTIDNFPDNNVNLNDFNLNAFYEGLGRNRSIKELIISNNIGESFKGLILFVRNNDSLLDLTFHGIDIGPQSARNVALLLDQQTSLKHLDFSGADLDDEGFLHIAKALRSQPQIEELSLYSNNLGRDDCVELGNTLQGCLSLRKLSLTNSDHADEDIGDEGLNALVAGLKHCHKLTSLSLDGIQMLTEEGSRSLSTLFQSENCRLEHLHLRQMNIDNDGMAVLATGIASLPSLKGLILEGMSIGDQGLKNLVRGLANCNVEELSVSSNMLTVSGLRSLGTLVRRSTNMRSLSLCNSSLTDDMLQSFIEGMANCCNLTKLNLSHNRSITANGLTSLSSLLRVEHCALRTLCLFGIHLGNDGAAALVNGLIGNKSLTTLRFTNLRPNLFLRRRGWAAFSRLLCDTSSVNNTYLSNHTLTKIGLSLRDSMFGTPRRIGKYLKLNQLQNKAAAICKILDSHPDIDVTPLFQWKMKCLPLVVDWLEKAKPYLDSVNESTESFQCRQLSTVYKFVHGMPLLAANGYRKQGTKDIQTNLKKKRKFDLTL